jgi:AraC family transcriptional regulator
MSAFSSWFSTMQFHFQGNAILRSSSESLEWPDIAIQHYEALPALRGEISLQCPTLAIFRNQTAVSYFRRDQNGRFLREVRRSGATVLLRPGPVQRTRTTSKIDLLLCGISDSVLQEAKEAAQDGVIWNSLNVAPVELEPELLFMDKAIRTIIELLHTELRAGAPSGRMYTEHLTHALACRIGFLARMYVAKRSRYVPILPAIVVKRVIEKISADITADHRLESLAVEAGYSRSHFLRAFAATLGTSPHQYVLKRRLNHARQLLSKSDLPIAEVAILSGFASHAHLSRSFHKHYGLPPNYLRRSRPMPS